MNTGAALGVGLIGYGYAGRVFHAPLLRAVPGLQLRAVASRDAARVHAELPDVQVCASPEALLAREDIALVVLATPNASHAPLARAALQAGRHVVVDKPSTLTLAEARELLALAARRQRCLTVFQNRRWDSDFLAVKQAIEADAIGRVVHFESHLDRYRPNVRERWREGNGPGAGIWYDLGPHLIDQALLLFGMPQAVQLHLAIAREGGLAADWAHARLDYGARQVLLHASMLAAGGAHRFLVHGTRGSLVKHGVDLQETQLLAGIVPGAPEWGIEHDPLRRLAGDGTREDLPVPAGDQRQFYLQLRDALRNGGEPPVTPAQALAGMAVLEAGLRSAREGRDIAPAAIAGYAATPGDD